MPLESKGRRRCQGKQQRNSLRLWKVEVKNPAGFVEGFECFVDVRDHLDLTLVHQHQTTQVFRVAGSFHVFLSLQDGKSNAVVFNTQTNSRQADSSL
jgi:hypothetical protein